MHESIVYEKYILDPMTPCQVFCFYAGIMGFLWILLAAAMRLPLLSRIGSEKNSDRGCVVVGFVHLRLFIVA